MPAMPAATRWEKTQQVTKRSSPISALIFSISVLISSGESAPRGLNRRSIRSMICTGVCAWRPSRCEMFQKRSVCGHCQQLADHSFKFVAEIVEPAAHSAHGFSVRVVSHGSKDAGPTVQAYGVACCPLCQKPNLFLFEVRYGHLRSIQEVLHNDTTLFGGGGLIEVTATFPKPIKAIERDHWPADLKPLFRDAQLMIAEKKEPAMIVVACRSALDVATKELGATGKDLANRIDDLAAKGVITAAMKGWSHRVRVAGNEAVHEIKATHEEAAKLIEFVVYFLDMCFTIPKTANTP